MRFLKTFLLMVLASAFLVACGGGGGSDPVTGGGSGGSNSDASLRASYNSISGGMTLAQVKAITGTEPSSDADVGGGTRMYGWVTGGSTSQLLVVIGTSGVKEKTFIQVAGTIYLSQKY
jgi:hypothetical protein